MATAARLVRDLQAGQAGHLDVEEQNVRCVGFERAQGSDTVLDFGDDLELRPERRESLAQLLAQDLLVFGDDRPGAWVRLGT